MNMLNAPNAYARNGQTTPEASPAVGVEVAVEDERPQRLIGGGPGRWALGHDLLQDLVHAYVGFSRGQHNLGTVDAHHQGPSHHYPHFLIS